MNDSLTSENMQHRPSAIGAFLSGGMSGLVSGLVMSLIIAAVVPALPLVGLAAATTATFGSVFAGTLMSSGPIMVIASTLFGGIMGAKRALFDTAGSTPRSNTIVPVPVPAISAPGMAPTMAMTDESPTQAPAKSWVAETGRGDDSRTRIQQILADGSLSDKDRASAILASRQAADAQASRA